MRYVIALAEEISSAFENGILDNRPIQNMPGLIDPFPCLFKGEDFFVMEVDTFYILKSGTDKAITGYVCSRTSPEDFTQVSLTSVAVLQRLKDCGFNLPEYETAESLAEKLIDPGYCACKGDCTKCENKKQVNDSELKEFFERIILVIMGESAHKPLTKEQKELLHLIITIMPTNWQTAWNNRVKSLAASLTLPAEDMD
jgi:hypothetical protein